MEFKVETIKLVAMFDIIGKGVGDSKIMPITEYVLFKIEEGKLKVTATDLNNFITYELDDVEGQDGEVIIHAESIMKLADRTTKSEMEFKVLEDHVRVKGNGTYKIALLDAEEFTYPTYEFEVDGKGTEIDVDKLKKAFRVNERSISKEMLTPVLSGYNVGGKVITTDGIKMCINGGGMLDSSVLVTQTMSDLIIAIPGTSATVYKSDGKILVKADNVEIFGSELEGIEDYPDITPLLDIEHEGDVTIDKMELMSALNRLSIFSDPFDNNGVTMIFKKELVELSDLKRNSIEEIKYKEINGQPEVITDISVNIQFMKDLISVLSKNEVQMRYGEGLPLKIVEEEVVQILGTMEVTEEEEEE